MSGVPARAASACWRVASLPATLAHELTHMLLAAPWADETAVAWHADGVACFTNWTPSAPRWAIVLASLGPTILGSLVGIGGLWQMLTAPPSSSRELLITAAIAAWWVIYTTPSGDDLDIHNPDNGDH